MSISAIEPVTLEGRVVRLEPLNRSHAAALLAAANPDLFTYASSAPAAWTLAAFEQYVDRSLADTNRMPFAIVARATEQAVGTTSYGDLRLAHRGLEIGWTWIGKAQQGTLVNPESKYLLLRHAFETLELIRVQLKCDARNLHSQRAIAKLGAVREGVLRKHLVLPDGFIRDTVLYSITDDDWPEVKAGLERRLAGIRVRG
jgi:N-acetyltransferase